MLLDSRLPLDENLAKFKLNRLPRSIVWCITA
jgi:hypothetical protein